MTMIYSTNADAEVNLDRFIAAYVECALWSSIEGEDDTPMDQNYDADDIAESSLVSIRLDCAQFVREQGEVLDYVDEHDPKDAYVQAGHDFWLTRNGHGAGFWDGDWSINLPATDAGFVAQAGDVLTTAAKNFGACDLYVGDDGKVYVTPERAS